MTTMKISKIPAPLHGTTVKPSAAIAAITKNAPAIHTIAAPVSAFKAAAGLPPAPKPAPMPKGLSAPPPKPQPFPQLMSVTKAPGAPAGAPKPFAGTFAGFGGGGSSGVQDGGLPPGAGGGDGGFGGGFYPPGYDPNAPQSDGASLSDSPAEGGAASTAPSDIQIAGKTYTLSHAERLQMIAQFVAYYA